MEVKLLIVSFTFSQQEREKYIFLLPLPCPSVFYYTCTSTPAHATPPPPTFTCYQVPACQCLAENIFLSENPWISWVCFWADPLEGWWALMGSLLAYSSYAPSPSHFWAMNPHHEYPVIEGILRMGNANVCPDAKHPSVHCRGSFMSSVRSRLQAF